MAAKAKKFEREELVVYTYKGGRREIRKELVKIQYGGKPSHTRAEVEEFLRKRREG